MPIWWSSRIDRENTTVAAMIRIYCRGEHGTLTGLCPKCDELLDYARARLRECPYQEDKMACADCPIHCYEPEERERIRIVMRYAGPRMLRRHPILALLHALDGLGKRP